MVEIFNINSVTMLAPLAATKIYIFPILLFVFFRQNKDVFGAAELLRLSNIFFVFVILESLLSLYQLKQLEQLMLQISPFYSKAMKGEVFIGKFFRPFGTAFLPGAIAAYLYLSTGFLFLRLRFTKSFFVLISAVVGLLFVTLLVCQVRSAMLKYIFILLGIAFAFVSTSQVKFLKLLQASALLLLIIGGVLLYVPNENTDTQDTLINLESGLTRWKGITTISQLKSNRLGPVDAFKVLLDQLEKYPIGVGPGLTGAASSVSTEELKNDPLFKPGVYWAYDNFYLSLFIEFGYGAVFYLAFILGIPLLLYNRYRVLKREKNYVNSRIVFISLVHVCVVLLGNWGAVGIPYNPESFLFWLWAAIGLNVYDNAVSAGGA